MQHTANMEELEVHGTRPVFRHPPGHHTTIRDTHDQASTTIFDQSTYAAALRHVPSLYGSATFDPSSPAFPPANACIPGWLALVICMLSNSSPSRSLPLPLPLLHHSSFIMRASIHPAQGGATCLLSCAWCLCWETARA